jgi:deoxyribodipyrimidine photo-lyase
MDKVSIFWFRRDLRLHDNAALFHALQSGQPVVPVFIFDRNILDHLEDKKDKRVEFIHTSLAQVQEKLLELGSTLHVFHGEPLKIWKEILKTYPVSAVFTNHDYEPYAQERDRSIEELLSRSGIPFQTYKDQVIFEKSEVVKDDGKPYTVYTPYSRKWRARLTAKDLAAYPTEKFFKNFYQQAQRQIPTLNEIGFLSSGDAFPPASWTKNVIQKYKENRDFPALPGTSRLGVHLRFGTISIRELARTAGSLNDTFMNELIWREFYHMILWNFPQVGKGKAFRPEYDLIKWRNNEKEFTRWCEGQTGYPIVDAGMRELNATGYMHNRVRMIVASFLTKHLLIDWRWGEAYFASKLLDFDLAANNGGWQWAAGSGCDAAPYFRVFNPRLQTQKFDPECRYIRQWVPEFESFEYPKPMVDHDLARKRCLEVYAIALKKS